MEQSIVYIALFCVIVVIGQLVNRLSIPLPLLLVITGMLLSTLPSFKSVTINPPIVLNIFLPLMVYQISSFTSWKDFKKNIRSITLLSIGHVIFITIIVAILLHILIPKLDWALAVMIGAIISPPDDVAIVSIAEKIRMPNRVITILEGEGMLNDATALTLFRFALAAALTHQFLPIHAISVFFLDIIGETMYGILLGYVLGELRLRITSPSLHIIASLLTPFLAYFPAELLGGSGIIATVATGFVIGHIYSTRFTPGFRLISRAMWPSITFGIQSMLFFLVGLDMISIMQKIGVISWKPLLLYSSAIILTVIIGRFIWVYCANIYIPRRLFASIRKRDPHIPWQYPFLVSWAGMRGSISMAAALAVPFLSTFVNGVNIRDFLIFLVSTVIIATLLLQGLALPWLLKIMGIAKISACEEYSEHIAEMIAKKRMAVAALRWLTESKKQIQDNPRLYEEIKFWMKHYKIIKTTLHERIADHHQQLSHDEEAEITQDTALQLALIEIEKNELMKLWRNEEINLTVRNKLLEKLDHAAKNLKA